MERVVAMPVGPLTDLRLCPVTLTALTEFSLCYNLPDLDSFLLCATCVREQIHTMFGPDSHNIVQSLYVKMAKYMY